MTHQLDEIFSHALVVLIDSMHNGIDEGLLVGLTQLGHIAKVYIGNAAVCHGKNVARVGIPMEKPKLHAIVSFVVKVSAADAEIPLQQGMPFHGREHIIMTQGSLGA